MPHARQSLTFSSSGALALSLSVLLAGTALGQSPLKHFPGGGGNNEFGWSCCGIGDVTGDGLGDVAVGDPLWSPGAGFFGQVRVFNGNTGGLLYNLNAPTLGDEFGYAVAGLGDIDSDGRGDFIVGSHGSDLQALNGGAARIYSGASGSLLFTVATNVAFANLGRSVAGVRDADGDLVPDFVVGAPGDRLQGSPRGSARVYSGATGAVIRTYWGDVTNDAFGICVSDAGDYDGDGLSEIWVGANQPNPGGVGYARLLAGVDGHTLLTLQGLTPEERFASSIAGGSDMDGDGVPDVLVGATHTQLGTSTGVLRAYSGLSGVVTKEFAGQFFAEFPSDVDFVGDINNDGRADFIAGERSTNSNQMTLVQVVSGATLEQLFSLSSTANLQGLGRSVAGVGDCSGDGIPDLLASSTHGLGFARTFSGFDEPPVEYCQAKSNSLGCEPSIGWTGVPALSGDDNFRIRAEAELNQRTGLLFWGAAPASVPFGGGTLCVSAQFPIHRGMAQKSGGTALPTQDCSGTYEFFLSHQLMLAKGLIPGTDVYAQFLSRDPGFPAPHNVALTNGLHFTVAP